VDPSDERGLVVSFFVKLFLFLAITGVAAADISSIFFANLRADDAASAAASACAATYKKTRDVEQAAAEALDVAAEKSEDVTVTEIAPDTTTGRCTVSTVTTAATLVVGKIGPLKKHTVARATETVDAPNF
jgi:hypothetical protein